MIKEIIQNGNSYNVYLAGNKSEIIGQFYSFINHSLGRFVPEINWINNNTASISMSKENFNHCIFKAELFKILNLRNKESEDKMDIDLAKKNAESLINNLDIKNHINNNIIGDNSYKIVDSSDDNIVSY